MTLFIFKFCLPVLLGYTLFVGIAGRLNPFKKPHYLEERPSWMLGLWTGLSVTLVLGIGLQLAYGMSLANARSLLAPSSWLLAAMLVPGFIAFFYYRHAVHKQIANSAESKFQGANSANDINDATLSAQFSETEASLDEHQQSISEEQCNRPVAAESDTPLVATFLEHAELDTVNTQMLTNDTANDHQMADNAGTDVSDELNDDIDPLDQTIFEPVQSHALFCETAEIETSETALEPDAVNQPSDTALPCIDELVTQLDQEKILREETEKHLRITRKALSVMEAQTRNADSRDADTVIELEEKLATSINLQCEFETLAAAEKNRRLSAETAIANLKQDLVNAKHDIRRSTAARAKALSTANKSIAFARQTVQIRARLESEIEDAKETLKNRQATISSLIRALEKEKRHTQESITSMAKQLVLHEKQLSARRSLEEVAKSVENKLTSRLVKKVAKARPLISDH